MKAFSGKYVALVTALFVMVSGAFALDVTVTAPQIELGGIFAGLSVDEDLNTEMNRIAREFEDELTGDPDIDKFSRQPKLAEGFANAGSGSSMSGLLRIQHDYKLFSAAYGFTASASMPDRDFLDKLGDSGYLEDQGDIYTGLAVHPFNFSASVNLGFLVPGLRANAKFGYLDVSKGSLAEDISFNSLSVGAGASYQLIKPKSVPAGLLKWHGLVVASGLYYQRNRVEMNFIPNDDGFEGGSPMLLGDFLDPIPPGYDENTVFGTLTTAPELIAKIESSTVTIPLEVSTAVRVLYVLDLMAGAGVDLSFGSSEVSLRATSDVDFIVNPDFDDDDVTVTPGDATITNKSTADPQLVRPRLMTGIGFGAGPIRVEVPFIMYFDSRGNTYVASFNVGIMF